MNIVDGIPILGIKPQYCLIIILSLFLVLPASLSTGSSPANNGFEKFFVGGNGSGNYSTIQEAIDIADPGDTIFVFTGIYSENILINKSIYLRGEGNHNTIIKNQDSLHTVYVTANYVTLDNFTIQGTPSPDYYNASIKFSDGSSHNTVTNCILLDNYYGIWLYSSKYNDINNCVFSQNTIGVWVHHMSNYNTIHDCTISNNSESGIYFCCMSSHNTIYHNTISFNGVGAKVDSPNNPNFENTFYLNNFVNNSKNARNSAVYKNFWDNGSRGNYWSDYDEGSEGAWDNDSDGIVDSPYVLSLSQDSGEADNYDNYPLRYPWQRDIVNLPHVLLVSPHDGMSLNGIVMISGTADDFYDSLQRVEIRFDEGPWITANGTKNWTYNWNTTAIDDGTHTISVRSFNGHQYSVIETITVSTMNTPDNNLPIVSITFPLTGTIVSGDVEIRGEAIDSDGIIQKVEIKTDNSSWNVVNGTSPWSTLCNTHLIPNGDHRIYVRSYDGRNYSPIHNITVTVFNNHLPQVIITVPLNGDVVSGNLTIQGIASDMDGNDTLQKVQVRINTGEWCNANGTNTWQYLWNPSSDIIDEGSYIIYVRAWDGYNYSAPHQIMLIVDYGGNQDDTPGFEFLVVLLAFMSHIIYINRKK